MMGVVRVFGKTVLQSSHTPQQSDVEEWLDRELSSLRQSVETDAGAQQAPNRSADARSHRRRALRFGATRAKARWIAHRALRVPMHSGRLLRLLRRVVDRRRFEIVLYGCSVALAVAVGWLVSSMIGS
jgi:hypothetical protein